ncbi:MAG TPA: HAD-IA family hydrolase [Bryobacteraceae bacterium]|nr:HAD-IA family hydrolase [Bryobacteraceae bacterium]
MSVPRFPVYLFDIDGTLLDSARDICGAIQQVLAVTPCDPPVSFDFLKSYIGLSLNDLFLDLFPGCTPDKCETLFQQYRSFYHARKHAETSVYPGVSEGLRALRGKKSTATSKGTPFSRFTLEHFGLLQYFDHVQGTDGFPSKPAPNVIFTALEALGAKPEDCLFVGDSRVDMEAGRRAGVKTCAVRYGYGKEAELAQFEPDYWVDDLRELAS